MWEWRQSPFVASMKYQTYWVALGCLSGFLTLAGGWVSSPYLITRVIPVGVFLLYLKLNITSRFLIILFIVLLGVYNINKLDILLVFVSKHKAVLCSHCSRNY